MNKIICFECHCVNQCSEFQDSPTSDRAYYDWVRKLEHCQEQKSKFIEQSEVSE